MADQLTLFDLAPAPRPPTGQGRGRRATRLTFEYDPDEWDEVIRLAARMGQTVEAVGEEAMRVGVRELLKGER